MAFDFNSSVEILERTPKTFKTLLKGLSDDWIYSNEGSDTWSPFDIVGHLIHGEKTDWIPRLKIILDDSKNKVFEPFDRFAQFEASKGKVITILLQEFDELRSKNIRYLKSLNLNEYQLRQEGIHPDLGKVSSKELLATWVTHDLSHIAQMARVMAKQYKNDVGPWIEYLSILK